MDSELTELDDWVGTLAELQLGLERKCPSVGRVGAYSADTGLISSPLRQPCLPARHVQPPSEDSMPPALPPRRQLPLEELTLSPQRKMSSPAEFNGRLTPPPLDYRIPTSNFSHSIRASFNPLSCREATAENDLNCLLRQLQEVEETMKELEQDDNDFTRRYSLASSSNTDKNTNCNPSPAPDNTDQFARSTDHSPLPLPPPPPPPALLAGRANGPLVARSTPSPLPPSVTAPKNGMPQRQLSPMSPPMSSVANSNLLSPPLLKQLSDTVSDCDYLEPEIPAPLPPLPSTRFSGNQSPQIFLPQTPPPRSTISSSSDPVTGRTTIPMMYEMGLTASARRSQGVDDSYVMLDRSSPACATDYQRRSLERQHCMSNCSPLHRFPSEDSADGLHLQSARSLSSNPCEDLSGPHTNDGSSLSDKSVSDIPEIASKLNQVCDMANRLQLTKLVVRIFRPDKTTKAILIDQRMSAGEVASMLIEKNFLEPSIKLCLVEKVPSLKVERVFEEAENVAECILAWPARSQNMIFFESREDQFGFIDSPRDWLGEAFADAHGLHSRESIQKMLTNSDMTGLPEWHDFLYIRKPGEKTWTRRMCVLRNSGLYTTKKNKKTFSASDLIRLLVLDDKLHIYTTTGGWSRMRAPTPHGFALKTFVAQEFSSTHVFCFCAPDESSLRQWICRLRIAKYGKLLWTQYVQAQKRIIGSCGQSNAQQVAYKMLMRKSSLEVSRQNNGNCLPQSIMHRQSSTGNLNFPPGKLPSYESISQQHPCLSPPLVRAQYQPNGFSRTPQHLR